MKKIAPAILILFFAVQCKNSAMNTETINPISCLEKQTTVFSGSNFYQLFKNVYENNLLKKVEYYSKENKLLSFITYQYDTKGILIKTTSLNAENNVLFNEKTTYKLNKDNLFSEIIVEGTYNDNTRSYDKNNYVYTGDTLKYVLHSSETAKIDSIIYNLYSPSGRPTEIRYFHREFDTQPFQLNIIEKREYDTYQNLIKTEQYYVNSITEPYSREIYTYSNIANSKWNRGMKDNSQYVNLKDKDTHIRIGRESYSKVNSADTSNLYKNYLDFNNIIAFNSEGCVEKIIYGNVFYDVKGNSTSSNCDTMLVAY